MQPDPLRGIPMCSDDHRYMCISPSPFPLAHPLATQVVCLLAQYLVQLLDAVTGWISSNDMIAASYEPVSILWDVLGALEAMVRMRQCGANSDNMRFFNGKRRRNTKTTRKMQFKYEGRSKYEEQICNVRKHLHILGISNMCRKIGNV